MKFTKDQDPALTAARVCLVAAYGCTVSASSPAFVATSEALIGERQASDFPPAELKEAVRAMLRTGGFKPAGRQKPASEYLAQAAREGRYPFINAAVDVNNYFSLLTGLPISLLDSRAFDDAVQVRICKPGETYVFNNAGHEMDLAGLLCVCSSAGQPLGNPVKDSMVAKLKEDSRDLLGFLYAPAAFFSDTVLQGLGEEFAALLRVQCRADSAALIGLV